MLILQEMTPAAKRKADAAAKRKAAVDTRKAQLGAISKKRGAMEQAKVRVCKVPSLTASSQTR
jgi:hypothetical protein